VNAGQIGSLLILLSSDAVRVIGTGLQKNCVLMPEVPFHGVVIGVWCVVRAVQMYMQ